ncbi:glycosyltransferase family 2 protein [Litchfieldella rifensis]|uniref:Glycosyltransferase family 2 protein n=1 Tax=Litchfieldella rifensis TaxID=762643 RepID=A0ABV7LTN2_9GAMM
MKYSVIVPVYEHWHLVPALIACLQAQSLSQRHFEVLLVDNGSQDFQPPQGLPENVTVLRCDTPGSYAARNHAIQHAQGDWYVFTDADCQPYPDWLEQLDLAIDALSDGTTILAGAVNVISASSRPNAYEKYDMVKGIPQAWYVSRGYAATANLAVHSRVVAAMNGFDASRYSGGDTDFCRRACKAGYTLAFVPSAVVNHPARDTWQALATKAKRIKGGQIIAGSLTRRTLWLLRTLTPPSVAIWRFATNTKHPFGYRVTAVVIQFRIWRLELWEVIRLMRVSAERR